MWYSKNINFNKLLYNNILLTFFEFFWHKDDKYFVWPMQHLLLLYFYFYFLKLWMVKYTQITTTICYLVLLCLSLDNMHLVLVFVAYISLLGLILILCEYWDVLHLHFVWRPMSLLMHVFFPNINSCQLCKYS